MSWSNGFDRLLSSLHEAVFDDAHWPAASGIIDQICGSRGNVFVFGDGVSNDDVQVFFARVCYGGKRREECEHKYFRLYHPLDERLPRLGQLPDGQVAPVSSLLTEEQMKTSLVYNELLRPAELGNALHVRLDGPDGSHIVWTAANPIDPDGWSSAQIEMMQRVLPHLRQFFRLRQALVDASALGASLGDLLVNVRVAVIHLDRQGRVAQANDRARAIFSREDGLMYKRGVLCASLSNEDAELGRVLARALPFNGGAGESGSVMVSREHSALPLVVHVSPVKEQRTESRPGRVGAILLVIDPSARSLIDPARVGAILGLTPAESRVAAKLAEGLTIRDIAAATGRSPTTVKWHVRHVFSKLGVSRQADLVRLLMSLSDIPGVRR